MKSAVNMAVNMKEKRRQVFLLQVDRERLISFVGVIDSDLEAYHQSLTQQWQRQCADPPEELEEQLQILSYLQYMLPNFLAMLNQAHIDEKTDKIRLSITDEEFVELRALYFCTKNLPDNAIAWSEFAVALEPLMNALDAGAFEAMMISRVPKKISCRIEDFKRGRELPPVPPVNSDLDPPEEYR